jgi:hypothetical protein
MFGSLGRKRKSRNQATPLLTRFSFPMALLRPLTLPSQLWLPPDRPAHYGSPRRYSSGSHGLALRTTCSRPYQSHNGVQIRAREKRSAPTAGRRRRRPQSLCPHSHQRLKVRSQLLLPLQLQVFMDPSPMYLILSSKGMYNAREDTPSLSPPCHLEKAIDISCTMHHLLLSYLAFSENRLFFVRN